MTTAQLIDGNALSKQLREDVAARTIFRFVVYSLCTPENIRIACGSKSPADTIYKAYACYMSRSFPRSQPNASKAEVSNLVLIFAGGVISSIKDGNYF